MLEYLPIGPGAWVLFPLQEHPVAGQRTMEQPTRKAKLMQAESVLESVLFAEHPRHFTITE